jgi:brefeldin A-inhibited guanine nucleotide-exchange protein
MNSNQNTNANNQSNQNNLVRSADMFLTRALEKMLADKEMKKSTSAHLKKQCETFLNQLRTDARNKPLQQYVQINDAENYFVPFELACKAKSPRIVETALDCIQVKFQLYFYLICI